MKVKRKTIHQIATVIIFTWILTIPLRAYEDPQADEGFCLSFKYINLSIHGDLDGKMILGNFEKVFYIPKLGDGTGFSFSIGRKRRKSLWEVFYLKTSHNTIFQDKTSKSYYNAIGIDGKIFLIAGSPFRPYINIGFNVPWLFVKNGAIMNGSVKNAVYIGAGLDGGGGLLVHLDPNLFISIGAVYRIIGMLSTLSPGKGRDILDLYIDQWGARMTKYLWSKGLSFEASFGFGF